MKRHIPNAFTFGNLFCGFLSTSYTINGELKSATILIFIAIMLDAVDGRIARILGVSNPIGKELDSLADIVSFGVAPAYLTAYSYFINFNVYGLIMAGAFPLFGAYRLARFNITSQEESLKHFNGIPITLAGGVVTFLVLFQKDIALWVFIIAFYLLCILMVSTIKLPSFKKVGLPKNSVLITLFLFYMFYLFARAEFKHVPFLFYIALSTYILFISVRYIKEKEPKFPIKNKMFVRRFKVKRKRRNENKDV